MYFQRIILAAFVGTAGLSRFALAEPIPASAVEVTERQVIVENYCCAEDCEPCTGILCETTDCSIVSRGPLTISKSCVLILNLSVLFLLRPYCFEEKR